VPHVRTSVHGLKTTGRSPYNALCHLARKGRLLRLASWCMEQKHWKNPFSAQVRFGEPGAPIQFLMGSVRRVYKSTKQPSALGMPPRYAGPGTTMAVQRPRKTSITVTMCNRMEESSFAPTGIRFPETVSWETMPALIRPCRCRIQPELRTQESLQELKRDETLWVGTFHRVSRWFTQVPEKRCRGFR
jgi:hypothetical protein